jgi:hypothetical protein
MDISIEKKFTFKYNAKLHLIGTTPEVTPKSGETTLVLKNISKKTIEFQLGDSNTGLWAGMILIADRDDNQIVAGPSKQLTQVPDPAIVYGTISKGLITGKMYLANVHFTPAKDRSAFIEVSFTAVGEIGTLGF